MIAIIRTGNFVKGALDYNLKKIAAGDAGFLFQKGFEPGADYDAMLQTLQFMAEAGDISKPVFHTSLSFARADHDLLDTDMLETITRQYMQDLGYGNTPYVVFQHNDTGHKHVHILSVNLHEVDGKIRKIPDSFIHRRSMAISRNIEKEYNLKIATDVSLARAHKTYSSIRQKYGINDTYETLRDVTKAVIETYNYSNLFQLNALLQLYGIRYYSYKDRRSGNICSRVSFVDAHGERQGISGSTKRLAIPEKDELAKRYDSAVLTKTELQGQALHSFREAMSSFLYLSEPDFSSLLNKHGLLEMEIPEYAGARKYYLHTPSNTVFSARELKIHPNLIGSHTIRRNEFRNVAILLTKYMRQERIFHESSFWANVFHVEKFSQWCLSNLSGPEGKRSLLLDTYMAFKMDPKNRQWQISKEHKKDVAFVSKLIAFTNSTGFSAAAKNEFIKKFGIYAMDSKNSLWTELTHDNGLIYRISNNVDGTIHHVKATEITAGDYGYINKKILPESIEKLFPKDCALIAAYIYGKEPQINGVYSDVLKDILPPEWLAQYNVQLYDHAVVESYEENNSYGRTIHVDPIYDAYYQRWGRSITDEDEESRKKKRRRRN